MKLISWNIAQRKEAWRRLLDTDADVALLQEATEPPPDVASRIEVDAEPWHTCGDGSSRPWRAAVVRLTNRVQVDWLTPIPLEQAVAGDLAVSRSGTLAAAEVTAPGGARCTLVSMYGLWESPHRSTSSSWIYADASVHRLVSDLAVLIGQQRGHRIVAAGDLNILYGYGEDGSRYWAARYGTIFKRMEAMGMPFVGPQAPNGRRAEPWPTELPKESNNVPTYHSTRQVPAQAARQLDFVFASTDLVERIHVRALNDPNDWGPSDHCRVWIELR
jgi:endonuclease/exonuclease/phosphatase family metal-dependent hydrolase